MMANRLLLSDFVLDLTAGELLTSSNQLAGLRKQALDVLLVLGAHAGQVVSKDELMRLVWPDVVVGEGSLAQAIADVRRVLADSDHRLVRNVARRGYMLVPDAGPFIPAAEALQERGRAPLVADSPALDVVEQSHRNRLAIVVALVALMVTLAGVALDGSWTPNTPATLTRPLPREVPLTSLVVLPLTVEGDAAESEWFADALLADLTTEVGRLWESFVIARDTAYTYKGRQVDSREVARELRVRYVVRGSLRYESAVVHLSLSLVDGESGAQRWAQRYVVERARLNQVLDEFGRMVGRSLSIEVARSAGDRAAALSPTEVSAEDVAMRAYALWFRAYTRENLIEALALLEKAVAMNPDSIRGWGGIAFMNLQAGMNGWVPDRSAAFRRIDAASAQLDRLDPDGHLSHQARVIQVYLKKDWPAMLRLTQAWAERHRQPAALGAYGMALVLNGRPEEGVAPLELALRLSPRDSFRAEWQYRLSFAYFMQGHYEAARDWGRVAQATSPTLPWPPIHAAASARLGDKVEGTQILDDFLVRHPKYEISQIAQRLGGTDPRFVDARDRLIASLRDLGLR